MYFKGFCFYINFLYIFIPILIVAGCGKKRPAKLQFIDQARLVDIPVPTGINPISLNQKFFDKDNPSKIISLSFKTSLSFDQLKNFYTEQMELSDWHLAWHADAQQSSLIFQKPNRICVIVIENLNGSNFRGGCEVRLISGPRDI